MHCVSSEEKERRYVFATLATKMRRDKHDGVTANIIMRVNGMIKRRISAVTVSLKSAFFYVFLKKTF